MIQVTIDYISRKLQRVIIITLIFTILFFFLFGQLNSDSNTDKHISIHQLSHNREYGLLIEFSGSEKYDYIVRLLNFNPLQYETIRNVTPDIWLPSQFDEDCFALLDDGRAIYLDRKFSKGEIVERNLMIYRFDSIIGIDTIISYKKGDTSNIWLKDITEIEIDSKCSLLIYLDEGGVSLREIDLNNLTSRLLKSFPNASECHFSNDDQQLLIVKPENRDHYFYNNKLMVYNIENDSLITIFKNTDAIFCPRRHDKNSAIYFVNYIVNSVTTSIWSIDDTGKVDIWEIFHCPYYVGKFYLFPDSIIAYAEPCNYPDTTVGYYDIIHIE